MELWWKLVKELINWKLDFLIVSEWKVTKREEVEEIINKVFEIKNKNESS